mmetsp:Transcript_63971/g.208681  ORF Transcript_63971/g.208681 Transcript_63971/m.208681 type:complete len:270 (-) Transcript_63971:576-1385(-)
MPWTSNAGGGVRAADSVPPLPLPCFEQTGLGLCFRDLVAPRLVSAPWLAGLVSQSSSASSLLVPIHLGARRGGRDTGPSWDVATHLPGRRSAHASWREHAAGRRLSAGAGRRTGAVGPPDVELTVRLERRALHPHSQALWGVIHEGAGFHCRGGEVDCQYLSTKPNRVERPAPLRPNTCNRCFKTGRYPLATQLFDGSSAVFPTFRRARLFAKVPTCLSQPVLPSGVRNPDDAASCPCDAWTLSRGACLLWHTSVAGGASLHGHWMFCA